MTLGEIVAEILHTMAEIERMLNQDVPEDEIDALGLAIASKRSNLKTMRQHA